MAAKKDPDLYYHTPTLTRYFALSSMALVVVLLWIILDDHSRQWKRIQSEFVEFDVAKTQAEIEEARAEVPAEKVTALRSRLQEARAAAAERREARRHAEAALRDAEDRLYRVDQEWRNAKAYQATVRYEYEQASVHGSPDVEELRQEYDRWNQTVAARVNDVQEATRARDTAQRALEDLAGGAVEAEKDLASLEQGVRRLEAKLENIEPWWGTRYLLNEPVLDVMAPSIKIRQVVVESLLQDINYTSIPRVDRCMTCHMAIEKTGYDEAPQPFSSHPRLDLFVGDQSPHPMERFGCSGCHYGRDRAVDFARATHIPEGAAQEEEWVEKYDWHEPHLWDFPMLPARYTDATCFKCHLAQDRVPGSSRARDAEDLYEVFGCFGCHAARGYEGLRKVGPDLTNLATKLPDPDWTYRWLEAPRGFRAKTRMPHFWMVDNNSAPGDVPYNHAEIRGIVEYLYDRSGSPELPALPGTGDAARGESLVDSIGCLGCHVVGSDPKEEALPRLHPRRFGPELAGIGSKSTPEWIFRWLKDPRSYWPETRMPDLRLTDQEALDITAYLMTLRNDEFGRSPIPAPQDQARDEMLLEYFRAKLTDAEAQAKLAALSDHERWVLTGERMIRIYGCFGCHNIPGFETAQPVSIDLSEEGSKSLHRFDFGHLHDVPHTRHDWIAKKLENPRIFDRGKVKTRSEYQKMPDFGFTPEEVEIATTTVLSFVKDRIPLSMQKTLDAREDALEAGRRLVRQRNCRGCHELEGEGRHIYDALVRVYQRQGVNESEAATQAEGFSPPPITVEGAKVEPDWLFAFLRKPTTIRSWLQIRMPSFHFSDEDANTLIAYFNALSEQPFPFETYHDLRMTRRERDAATQLVSREYFNCFACHQQGSGRIEGPASQWAPNLSLANGRLRPRWIASWLRNPQAIQPGTRMPMYFDPDSFEDSGPPDILDGDENAQIDAITKWVIELGGVPPDGAIATPTGR